MANYRQEATEITWDARQGFVKELCWRGHLFGKGNSNEPKNWFEDLQDFYDWSSCFMKDKEWRLIEFSLNEIERLLYHTSKNGKRFTPKVRQQMKEDAYKDIREVFRMIHKINADNKLYIPRALKKDPGKAMMDMN